VHWYRSIGKGLNGQRHQWFLNIGSGPNIGHHLVATITCQVFTKFTSDFASFFLTLPVRKPRLYQTSLCAFKAARLYPDKFIFQMGSISG